MLISITVLHPERSSRQSRTLHLKCDMCGQEFDRRFKHRVAQHQKHWCSAVCANKSKRVYPDVSRDRSLICKSCGKTFEVVCNTNQPDPKTCSRSCASSLNAREHNLVSNMQTPEARARAMKTRGERWKDGTVVHGMTGKHIPCAEGTKAVLREKNGGERNAFFGKKHTDETKQKMRDARSRLIVSGKMNWQLFGHKSGTHVSSKISKDVHFRSSWEEITMIYLDAASDVTTWDYECIRIPYTYDNHKRWYIPDFLVTFQDGRRELWEVKPKEFINAEKTMLKADAAKRWCEQNCVALYRTITKDDLHGMRL